MKIKQLNRDRRNFLKKGIIGLSGITLFSPSLKMYLNSQTNTSKKNKKMITRPLGKTGLKLPIVSMGVMNSDNPSLVQAALDAGIVHLDTAHTYQRGRNEEMIGTVVKGRPRDSFVIATKNHGDAKNHRTGQFTKHSKPGPFLKRVELSLKRLDLEYVDILYLHSVARRAQVLFEPYLTSLEKLKKEGKARFLGISTHTNEPEAIRAAADSRVYDVVLTSYNFGSLISMI